MPDLALLPLWPKERAAERFGLCRARSSVALSRRHFLITTLAEYQTRFWVEVADLLVAAGHGISFVSFDDRSTEMIAARGFRVHAATAADHAAMTPAIEVDSTLGRFGITDTSHWLAHERVTFGLRDTAALERKLALYLRIADTALTAAAEDGATVTLVQELGGFLSVIGAFFAARARGVDNWFVEPAFFRGRLFFLRNSFAAIRIFAPRGGVPAAEVAAYLAATRRDRAIVIPQKDRHQYHSPAAKIFKLGNARRLAEKLWDRHILGKRHEFGYIGRYVRTHLATLASSYALRRSYTPLGALGRFVYYPFHVPGDMALTLRSPAYLDQLALIDYLARALPRGLTLAVKEHPAMIGAVAAAPLKAILARYDTVALLPPSTNNYDVLRAAEAVVSVNSKSGAEAILVGRPVLVLGDAFYRESGLAIPIGALADLPAALAATIGRPPHHDETARLAYFDAVWRQSVPGELYVTDPASVAAFTASMIDATRPAA